MIKFIKFILCKLGLHNVFEVNDINNLYSKLQCKNCGEYFLFDKISTTYTKYSVLMEKFEEYSKSVDEYQKW